MSATQADNAANEELAASPWRRIWRYLVLPMLVAIGIVFIAVGLIEGPPVGDFLYAIF